MSIADQRSPENISCAETQPLSIDLSPHVANKLCRAFKKFARRRGESGGLLFGEVQNPIVHVRAFKSFPDRVWQTARMPRATLNGMLTACRSDPDLSGLDWVGWYSLRASGGLNESDLEFHNTHFHRSSDVALIVRLESSETVSLEFYSQPGMDALRTCEQRRGVVSVSRKCMALDSIQVIIRDTYTAPPLAMEEVRTDPSGNGEPPHEPIRGITNATEVDLATELGPKGLPIASEDVAGPAGLSQSSPQMSPVAAPDRSPLLAWPLRSHLAIEAPSATSAKATPAATTLPYASRVSSIEVGEMPVTAPHSRPEVAAEVPGAVPVSTEQVKALSQHAPEMSAATAADTPEPKYCGSMPVLPIKAPAERFPGVARPQSGPPVHSSEISKAPVLPQHEPPRDISRAPLRAGKAKRPVSLIAIGSAAMVLLAVSGVAVAFSVLRHPSHAVSGTQLGLRVLRLDRGQLELGWDPDAPEIRNAQAARLIIIDGSLHKELNLGSAQLHLGRLIYFPYGTDVQFRLQVFVGDKRSVTEFVRVIVPGVKQFSVDWLSKRRMSATESPAHRPQVSPEGTVTFVPSGPEDGNLQRQLKSHDFWPPPHEGAYVIPPPDIRVKGGSNLPPAVALTALSKRPVAPAAAPVQPSAPQSTELQNALIPAFVPPHPVRQVMPDIRPLGLADISAPTEIAITVKIDESGTVYDASPVGNIEGLNRLLINAAVIAAKQWKFTPGTIRGKPAATEHTIIFEFRPRVE